MDGRLELVVVVEGAGKDGQPPGWTLQVSTVGLLVRRLKGGASGSRCEPAVALPGLDKLACPDGASSLQTLSLIWHPRNKSSSSLSGQAYRTHGVKEACSPFFEPNSVGQVLS